jgi:hypothetical protein
MEWRACHSSLALRMTVLDPYVDEELSSSFEPCLMKLITIVALVALVAVVALVAFVTFVAFITFVTVVTVLRHIEMLLSLV